MYEVEKRYLYNKAIIDKLSKIVDEHPYLRFGQILVASNILTQEDEGWVIDPFYEEPDKMWKRFKESNIFEENKYIAH